MLHKIEQTGTFLLRVYDYICDGCRYISAWMILIMTLSICYEVFMRYLFNRPTNWVADLTDYTLLYTTFLASAWLLKHNEHVSLTLLTDHFTPKSKRTADFVTSLMGAAACCFIVWYGAGDSWDAFQRNIRMDRPVPVSKYIILMVVPFGCFLLLIQFIRNAFKFLRTSGESPQP